MSSELVIHINHRLGRHPSRDELGSWDAILGSDCDSAVPGIRAFCACPFATSLTSHSTLLLSFQCLLVIRSLHLPQTISLVLPLRAAARKRASQKSRSASRSSRQSLTPEESLTQVRISPPLIRDPSPSTIIAPVPKERNGLHYLDAILTSYSSQGITADPFCDDLDVLRRLLDGHGLLHAGSCRTVLSCRTLLFRHLAAGECVASTSSGACPVACRIFSRGFPNISDMSSSFFARLARAPARTVGNSRLMAVATALELHMDRSVKNFRARLQRLFQRECDKYIGPKSSSASSQIPFVLKHFHNHSLPYLLNIASKHGLHLSPATATPRSARLLLLSHFTEGGCSLDSETFSSECSQFLSFINAENSYNNLRGLDLDRTLDDQAYNKKVYVIRLLTSLRDRLKKEAMLELFDVLRLPYEPSMTLRNLQSRLFAHISSLRAELLDWRRASPSPDVSLPEIDEIRRKWPSIPAQSVKDDCIANSRFDQFVHCPHTSYQGL
ncbi:hypothetical protein NMY22_g261 [Coprinellus aureogranulatus]|nr:hypothetical protein NMY22_g261 [Coprinellus aureogranulatus]